MKARIKKTGEIINIANYAKVTLDQCDSWGNPIELGFDEVEILQEPTSGIDWEQRRYEIAKEMMKTVILTDGGANTGTENLAIWCVGCADALISELKKGGSNGSH